MPTPLFALLSTLSGVAVAADRLVPGDYPTLSAAVAASRAGDVVSLDDDDPSWDAALDAPIFVAFDLTIRSDDGDRVQIPGLKVSSGATLTLEHVEVAGAVDALWTEDGQSTEVGVAAIFVFESALRGEDIALPGVGEYGLLSVDGDVELSGLNASNFVSQRAVRALAYALPSRLVLSGCDLGNNAAGAVLASRPAQPGERASMDVHISQCLFYDNAATQGADILSARVSLALDTVVLERGVATLGGGAIWSEQSDLSVVNAEFIGPSAPFGAAIVARAEANLGDIVSMENVDFRDITATDATTPGGVMRLINTATTLDEVRAAGISAAGGTLLYLEDGSFFGTHLQVIDFEVGEAGGALYFHRYEGPWAEVATVTASVFCQGFGVDAADALVLKSEGYRVEFTNSVVQFNARETVAGLYISGAGAEVSQNTFTANDLRYFVEGNLATLTATNNIFDGVDYAVHLVDAASTLSGGYNLWNDMNGYVLESGSPIDVSTGAVLAPPEFWAEFSPTDCATDPFLAYGSPAINAGDPEILDGDGTRSDIGAFGGPDITLGDGDQDGWRIGEDCDDDDSAVNPGAAETWYDGVDADCAGDDDFDADLDGADAAPIGLDCDDTNTQIGPSIAEIALDGVDQDCDGQDGAAPRQLRGGCGGCGSGGAGAWALGALALLRRQPIRSRSSSGSRSGSASGSRTRR